MKNETQIEIPGFVAEAFRAVVGSLREEMSLDSSREAFDLLCEDSEAFATIGRNLGMPEHECQEIANIGTMLRAYAAERGVSIDQLAFLLIGDGENEGGVQ